MKSKSKRLTAKLSKNEYINDCFPTKIYNKLGQLEDIEDEMGVDLIEYYNLSKKHLPEAFFMDKRTLEDIMLKHAIIKLLLVLIIMLGITIALFLFIKFGAK